MPAATASTDHRTARRPDGVLRSASLRRIAIVVRDLPGGTASQLLASLDEASRRAIQRELASLADVDPVERKRALESFAGSLKRHVEQDGGRHGGTRTPGVDSVDDEFIFSRAAGPTEPSRSGSDDRGVMPASSVRTPAPAATTGPLDFLKELEDEELLRILGNEHAQTIAVVLASIPPTRAANLIPRFAYGQRQEVLLRIGRLQQIPEDLVQELAESLSARVESVRVDRHTDQLRELLGPWMDPPAAGTGEATAAQTARHVPAAALAASPRLQAILAEMPSGSPGRVVGSAVSKAGQSPTGNVDQSTAENGVRRESAIGADGTPHSQPDVTESQQAADRAAPNDRFSVTGMDGQSTDQIHQELVRLTPRELCHALGRVATRTAILALCGLPNKTADAAIAVLPRPQANEVRKQLATIGSMELREIDQAKEAVMRAARVHSATSAAQAKSPQASTRATRPAASAGAVPQAGLSAA